MTRHWKTLLLAAPLVAAPLLVACTYEKPAPVDQQPRTAAEKTVIDTQLKALQKAKDVQKVVDQQAADQNKQIDEQSK
jgi:hypothetical protein